MAEPWTEEIYRIWDTGSQFYVEVSEIDDVIHVSYRDPHRPQDPDISQAVGILDSQIPAVIKALQRLLEKREKENG